MPPSPGEDARRGDGARFHRRPAKLGAMDIGRQCRSAAAEAECPGQTFPRYDSYPGRHHRSSATAPAHREPCRRAGRRLRVRDRRHTGGIRRQTEPELAAARARRPHPRGLRQGDRRCPGAGRALAWRGRRSMTPRPPRERAIAAAHPAPAALADLEQRYRQALETFVEQDGGEEVLHEAHELGRFAVARGFGLLDVLAIHHAALRSLAAALPGRHDSADLASKTEEFLAQVVVLFEMTHRGWNERRADAKFRLLFDRNPQPMWAFDREDLRFLEVNIAAIAHYGYSRAEFAEMRVTDLRPAEDVPAFVAYREAARAKPPGYRTAGEWRHKLKNGRIIDVEIATHDIELLGRKATLVVVKDITEQKRAQAALLESEARERDARQRLESILDRMPMGCVVGDKDLRFTYWNPAAERIFGYKFEEVKGLHPFETNLVAGDRAEAEAKYARLRRGEAEGSSTTYNRTKDGRRIKCEWQNMPLLGVDGSFQGVIAMCQDITQRAETEEALQQALKMEAIGQLTGGVAHDFNNLLTVVMGNLELLERSLEGRAEDLSLLNAILAAAARGADLTRQLLAFSRRQTLEPQIVAVNKLVGGVTRLLARTLGENIEIKLVPAEDLWPVVVDPALLESALANLAINARDAMPDGGTLIIETMNTQLDQLYAAQNPGVAVRDYVALAISDTGTGMPHEVLARVF